MKPVSLKKKNNLNKFYFINGDCVDLFKIRVLSTQFKDFLDKYNFIFSQMGFF